MTSTLDEQKAAAVARARGLVGPRLAGGESAAARDEARAFIAAFYEHAPPADIAARSAEDLAGAALALWQFSARRRPGEAHVRVYNPTAARDGWSSPHTIVEMVNDDMPFLVDSASAAINDREAGAVRISSSTRSSPSLRDADGSRRPVLRAGRL